MINNLDKIKKSIKKEIGNVLLNRQISLIRELGISTDRFTIVDRREMTPELIDVFMALDPKSPSIQSVIPSGEKVRIRVGPSAAADYEVRYNYGLRADVDGPKILPDGRTRDFCVHLIDANKLYTKAEIDRLSNGFNLPVFQYAGGWWTQPDGTISPKCRHTWYQNLVIRK